MPQPTLTVNDENTTCRVVVVVVDAVVDDVDVAEIVTVTVTVTVTVIARRGIAPS